MSDCEKPFVLIVEILGQARDWSKGGVSCRRSEPLTRSLVRPIHADQGEAFGGCCIGAGERSGLRLRYYMVLQGISRIPAARLVGNPIRLQRRPRQPTPLPRLHSFFDTMSCRICRSRVKSATIRFSLSFSSTRSARITTGEVRRAGRDSAQTT
jgi:hypothetical protein